MKRYSSPISCITSVFISFVFLFTISAGTATFAEDITKPNETGPWLNTYVNTYTGNFFYQRSNLYIPGRGLSFDVIFSYNSGRIQNDWGYGNGWTFNYGMHYTITDSTIIIEREDGHKHEYSLTGTTIEPPVGVYDELLEYTIGKYLLESKHGIQYYFDNDIHKKITSIVDRNGNTLTFEYNSGELSKITDPSGRELVLTWNSGHLTEIKYNDHIPAKIIRYEYDTDGNMIKYTDAIGGETLYTYGDWKNITGITDTRSNSITIEYNSNKAVKSISCPAENTVKEFTYNTDVSTTKVAELISSKNLHTVYAFDENERITSILHPGGNNVIYAWDENNNVVGFTDKNGNKTNTTYDNKGNILTITDPEGNTETITYNTDFNFPLTVANKNGYSRSMDYDSKWNLILITDPLSNSMGRVFDSYGNITAITDLNGNTTTYTYDENGYLYSELDALDYSKIYTYDQSGNALTEIDNYGITTTYEYDLLDRNIKVTDALGNIELIEYDANGNLISETDKKGNKTVYEYDSLNRLIKITDPLGAEVTYTYDQSNRKTAETDKNGNRHTYEYNADGEMISKTDPFGNKREYQYDANGNRTSYTDKLRNSTTYEYNKLNRLIKTIDPGGYSLSKTYDALGNALTETNKNGCVTEYTYDALNRLVSAKNPMNNTSSYIYDANGNNITEVDWNGNQTNYEYDALNRQIEIEDPLLFKEKYSYDSNGNQIELTDKNGNKTTYSYDALNRLVLTTDPLGNTIQYSYDPVGNRISETNKNGNTITFIYDQLNRNTERTESGSLTERHIYDTSGNLIEFQNKRGFSTTYTYDELNRRIRTTDPLGNYRIISYDSEGHVVTERDELGNVIRYTYDCCRLTSKANPLGNSEYYIYDGEGNLISKTDINGNETQFEFDCLNRIEKLIDAKLNKITYAYDGNKIEETSPKGNQTTYEFDERNLLIAMTTPLGFETQISYDGNSNIVKETKPDDSAKTNEYDKLNRLTRTILTPDNTTMEYTYDSNGNVTEIETITGTKKGIITKAYNNHNQLISVINDFNGNFTKEIQYNYDEVGNRILMEANGGAINYTFNENNQMTTIKNKLGETTSYQYDESGRRTRKTYHNEMYATNDYDESGNLLSLNYFNKDNNPLARFQYEYDKNGNKTRKEEILPNISDNDTINVEYEYDKLNQLITENVTDGTLIEYEYDKDRNRLTKTVDGNTTLYNYDADNRLTGYGNTQNMWDNNGNLIIRMKEPDTTFYSYNFPNKLKSVILEDGKKVEYDWSGLWHRMGKTASPQVFTLTDCQFCPICCDCHENEVAKYNDAGEEQIYITMGYHHDEVISQQFWGLSYFSITDALGSIRRIIDEWDNIMARYDYDAFGVTIRDEDEFGDLNSYKYAGRIYDSEYGQYYYRARNYNPATGSFTTRDPLWLHNISSNTCGSSSNQPTELPYVYVENNPVNNIDPSGNCKLGAKTKTRACKPAEGIIVCAPEGTKFKDREVKITKTIKITLGADFHNFSGEVETGYEESVNMLIPILNCHEHKYCFEYECTCVHDPWGSAYNQAEKWIKELSLAGHYLFDWGLFSKRSHIRNKVKLATTTSCELKKEWVFIKPIKKENCVDACRCCKVCQE